MMGKRASARKDDEYDVVTGWRKHLCYMQRSGVTDKIKRRMRRWERRVGKIEARSAE